MPPRRTQDSCPVCSSTDCLPVHVFTVEQAANHLIPPLRSPARNAALVAELRDLWAGDDVAVHRCAECGFGFSVPFVAGTGAIYNLIGGGDQHYPGERFEFTETVRALADRGGADRLLELGAGSGAFLSKVLERGLAGHITAMEYDDSAVAGLRRLPGVQAVQGDVQALVDTAPEPFDVVCLFQVLEHMDRLDSVFLALAELTRPGSEVFIAVPNAQRTQVQEALTGFMDMPPVHIGRWTPQSLGLIARRHGFTLVDTRVDTRPALVELWALAKYRLEQRTRRPAGAAATVERISLRPARGAIKRAMAGWDLAVLSPHLGRVPPSTTLFHLRRT